MEKPAPSSVPIQSMIARRWSARAVDPDRSIDPQTVQILLEAARWAPSSGNEQPWRYLVFDGRDPAALEAARSCLVEGNSWARRWPLLLLSIAREHFSHKEKPNRHAQHDVGMASLSLVLQATELGLSTHQMAGYDADRARELFAIPEGFTPMAMIVVGYPGKTEELSAPLQEREMAPRARKPIEQWAFAGKWEKPYAP